jgi:hypothetical protein
VWQGGETLDSGSASGYGGAPYARKVFCQGGVFLGKVAKHCPDICVPETDNGHLELC